MNGAISANTYYGDGSNLTGLAAAGGWVDDGNVVRLQTSTDKVGIGTTDPKTNLEVIGNIWQKRFGTGDGQAPNHILHFARGSSNSPNMVSNGDDLAWIAGGGYDGGIFQPAAGILMEVDGVPGSNDMPGRIVFQTTQDNTTNLTGRMVIKNDGNVGIGTVAPSEKLEVNGTVKATKFIGDGSELTGIEIGCLDKHVHINPKTINANNLVLQTIGSLTVNLPRGMFCHFHASGDVRVPINTSEERFEFWVAISKNPGSIPGATYYKHSLRYYRLHDITELETESSWNHTHDVPLELYEMGYVGTDYQMYLPAGTHTLYWVVYLWQSGAKVQIGETGLNPGGSTFSVICIPTSAKGETPEAVEVKIVE